MVGDIIADSRATSPGIRSLCPSCTRLYLEDYSRNHDREVVVLGQMLERVNELRRAMRRAEHQAEYGEPETRPEAITEHRAIIIELEELSEFVVRQRQHVARAAADLADAVRFVGERNPMVIQ
jgi:hypothetical protein